MINGNKKLFQRKETYSLNPFKNTRFSSLMSLGICSPSDCIKTIHFAIIAIRCTFLPLNTCYSRRGRLSTFLQIQPNPPL